MRRYFAFLLTLTFLSLVASGAGYQEVKDKIEQIVAEDVPPGSNIIFTPEELTVLAVGEMAAREIDAVRDLTLSLGEGSLTWSSLVNFARLPRFEKLSSNWIFGRFFEGERPVTIDLGVESGNGTATVVVQKVEISGTVFEGNTLDFLVEQMIAEIYPDVKLGEPFPLEHNVESLRLSQPALTVRIAD